MGLDRTRLADRMEGEAVSQAELARRVGISQQAVGKLVNGGSRATTHLHKIARELGTTPAYLTGETDDPDADTPIERPLGSEARELVEKFGEMTAVDRRALLQIARSMVTSKAEPTVHAGRDEFKGRDDTDLE